MKKGESISLGKRSLTFVPIPMVHWPDSMVTYCPEEEILFSSDAFGQHYCCSKRFDDETEVENMFYEAQRYYANILTPFRKLIPNAVKAVRGLKLRMICSCHGSIWRSHIEEILKLYEDWSLGKALDRIIIVYDTMWGGTAAMATAIMDGIQAQGMRVKLYRYTSEQKAAIMSDVLTAKAILVGSPTQNCVMMPTMGAFMMYLKGMKLTDKKAAAFGTYGWAGGAEKELEDAITAMSLYRYPFVLTNRLILSATYFASFPGERTSCSDTDSQLPLYFAPEYRNSSVSKNAISEQSRKRYTGLSNKHIGSSISVFFSPAIFIRDVTICLPSAKI